MKKFRYLLFLVVIYIFFWNPPIKMLFGDISLSYILTVASFFIMLGHSDRLVQHMNLFNRELLIVSFLICFALIRSGMEGDYIYIIRHLLFFANLYFVIPFLFLYARQLKLDNEKTFINVVFVVSSIAACISCTCLLVPAIDGYIRNHVIQYSEEDYLYGMIKRGYGLASGLTSYYGYIQGLIAAIGLFYFRKHKWFVCFIPLVFLSAIINARTGALITIWGVIALLFSKNKITLMPLALMILLFVFFLPTILNSLQINEATIGWILDFQDQVQYIYMGDFQSSSSASQLFDEMIILPSSLFEWIFGRGVSLFRTGTQVHTDVGWILQLNYGGLAFVLPLFFLFVYMIRRLIKNGYQLMAVFFAGVIIITNTKSSLFPSYGVLLFITLIYNMLLRMKKLRMLH